MTILGLTSNSGERIYLEPEARARGTYVIGATGTGKTTLLQSIAYQDMFAGDGVCVLDPHGDMIDWLLERVPPGRKNDVLYFNPADAEYPFGLNLLYRQDTDSELETSWVVDTIISTLHRLNQDSWGPRLEHVLSYTLWTAMSVKYPTLLDVLLLLTDERFRKAWIKRLADPTLISFWEEFPSGDRARRERLEFIASTVNKLTPFLLDKRMHNIVGQQRNSFDMRQLMDDNKILLVNLAKGKLGEHKSAILGSVIINLILTSALSRADESLEERQEHPFHVIVDEYQNFASESFSVLQSEARKYAIDLVVAHQFRDQLSLETRGSALNVGNFICFRTIGIDGPELASQFDNTPPDPDLIDVPILTENPDYPGEYDKSSRYEKIAGPRRLYSDVASEKANKLSNQPPYEFAARLIVSDPDKPGRLKLAEYDLITINPKSADAAQAYGKEDSAQAQWIRLQSQKRGRPRAEVEQEIHRRTGGRDAIGARPKLKEVEASEVIEGNDIATFRSQLGSVIMVNE